MTTKSNEKHIEYTEELKCVLNVSAIIFVVLKKLEICKQTKIVYLSPLCMFIYNKQYINLNDDRVFLLFKCCRKKTLKWNVNFWRLLFNTFALYEPVKC